MFVQRMIHAAFIFSMFITSYITELTFSEHLTFCSMCKLSFLL